MTPCASNDNARKSLTRGRLYVNRGDSTPTELFLEGFGVWEPEIRPLLSVPRRSGQIGVPAAGPTAHGRCGFFLVAFVQPCGIVNHMVVDRSPRLNLVFHALAHPARRAIIRQLSGGERNLSELASPLRMTFPAATKHVRVLEGAKLVRRRVVGRQHLCRLHAAPLKEATLWTEQFRRNWEARFEALDSLLEEMKSQEQSRSHRR